MDLTVDPALPDPPGYELGVLGAEVQDQDPIAVGILSGGSPHISSAGCPEGSSPHGKNRQGVVLLVFQARIGLIEEFRLLQKARRRPECSTVSNQGVSMR